METQTDVTTDKVYADLDGTPDGCVADGCDRCPGCPDDADLDLDEIPDDCDPCPGTETIEIFLPNSDPKSDILFVVDNSCSMGAEQAALGANFGVFISEMLNAGADWQVAVITTDSPNFRGAVISSATPNPAGVFGVQANKRSTPGATHRELGTRGKAPAREHSRRSAQPSIGACCHCSTKRRGGRLRTTAAKQPIWSLRACVKARRRVAPAIEGGNV